MYLQAENLTFMVSLMHGKDFIQAVIRTTPSMPAKLEKKSG